MPPTDPFETEDDFASDLQDMMKQEENTPPDDKEDVWEEEEEEEKEEKEDNEDGAYEILFYVKAQFSLDTGEPGDLALNKGDVIGVLDDSGEWWIGQLNGKIGSFPSNYTQEIDRSEVEGKVEPQEAKESKETPKVTAKESLIVEENKQESLVRAKFDFAGEEETDLPFKSGDIIKVIEKEGGDWWKGELDGQVGMFPANYVTEVKEGEEENIQKTVKIEAIDEPPGPTDEKARANFTFASKDVGDLSFKEGDIITILEKQEVILFFLYFSFSSRIGGQES